MNELWELTGLKHGEVRGVHGQHVEVGREPWHKPDQSVVEPQIGSAVPAGQDALLRRGQKELDKKKKKRKHKN